MNNSISRAGIRSIATLFIYFILGIFFSISSYSQLSNCEYASDYDIEVTMGVTTLQVHGDQCFSEGDKLIVTCVDNNNAPSRDTFDFVSCNAAPGRSSSQRTLTLSEFTADVDLSACAAVEVLYPDGSVGYYEILADATPDPGTDFSGFLNLNYCEDECLIFAVVDAWGAPIGVAQQDLCCVNGEIIPVNDCDECELIYDGVCNPLPGECEYPAVDFGCIEIGRSSTRTFYVTSCPFVKDQRGPAERNGLSELNTGIIECYYPDVDNLFDDRLALAEDYCEIIVYDIKIQAEHLDDMVVRDGPGELPFSLVGDFEFPISIKRGDNLPFQIEFAPEYYDYFDAVVTICYEFSDECECEREFFNQDRQALEDGIHCETSKWYDFTVRGAGKDSEEILGNGECRLKCPECIYTPDAIQSNGDVGGGPCGGYFEYTIGYADAGPPTMEDPVGRNGFSCGDLYLDTEENGQLYIYDEGFGIPDRLPEQQGWIPTPPAPYGLGFFDLECNQGARFSLPYIPYLFFDEEDAELYLVPGYGQPVEQIDIIVSLEGNDIVNRNGAYVNCGDYEPGDVFYIFPDELDLKQNALGEPIAYEFIACDGYRLFAKLVEDEIDPILPCSFSAQFPGTFSMGYYEPYLNGGPFREGCYAWVLDDCEPIPDLLTSNMDENLDGELEVVDPCSCSDPQNVYGNPGNTISLFHDFISVGGPNIDNTFDIEVEITQGELYDENNVVLPRLGDNNRIQLNWDPVRGTHFLEFWTEPGIGFGGQVYVNGIPSNDPDATLLSICDGPCAPIPTIGEWGIIILSILLLILGLVGLRQPKLIPQRIKK